MKKVTSQQLQAEILRDIRGVQLGVTDQIQSRVIQRTPVDSGTTRANIRVDTTSSGNSGLEFDPTRRDPAGEETISENRQRLISSEGVQNNLCIRGLAPWTGVLEFLGVSTQAPAGMFGVTLAELDEIVANTEWSPYR